MDYTYTAIGLLQLGGCADFTLQYYWTYAYAIGSVVYVQRKARKGIYERVYIKDVRLSGIHLRAMQLTATPVKGYKPLYVDSFNGYWNEDELVSYETATLLINQYLAFAASQAKEMSLLCK